MAASRVLKITNQGVVRFYEDSGSGTNYTGLRAEATLGGNVTYTLPGTDGSAGHILTTDGSAGMSWTGTLTALTITTLTSDTVVLDDQGELRLREATAGGTNYTGFKAPAALAGNVIYTLPGADGSSNQILITDGSKTLSWTSTLTALDIDALTSDGVTILNQGEIRLREGTGGGTNYTGFKAPATLAGDVIYTLPLADGAASTFLQTDGSGTLSWASSTATLQSAYDNGEDITCKTSYSTWTQANNNNGILQLTKTGTGTGSCLYVSNAGTGYGFALSQSGNQQALYITNTGNTYAIYIDQNCAAYGQYLWGHHANSGGLFVHNDGDSRGIYVDQDGGSDGIYIDQAANNNGLYVSKSGAGAGTGVSIINAGTGSGLFIDQNGNGFGINLDMAGTENALDISNAGTGKGIYLDQDGAAIGLHVDQAAVASSAVYVENAGTGHAININQTGIEAALLVDQDAADNAIEIDLAAGAGHGIDITNAGSDEDIHGHSGNWYVRPGGGAKFMGMFFTPVARTIDAAGAIAVTKDMCYLLVDTFGGGASDNLDNITGGTTGQILILQASNAAHSVVLRDAAGNILNHNNVNYTLNSAEDVAMYIYNGTNWCAMTQFADV